MFRFCPYPKAIYKEEVKDNYLAALMKEADLYGEHPHTAESPIEAAYFGGGTPSCLTESEIEALFKKLKSKLNLKAVEEITFEGNPASFTREKIRLLKSLGVNRISLGVQTFHDGLAGWLGLAHRERGYSGEITCVRNFAQTPLKMHFPNRCIQKVGFYNSHDGCFDIKLNKTLYFSTTLMEKVVLEEK